MRETFTHIVIKTAAMYAPPLHILQSERMQGFAVDPVYAKGEVFAYVGLPQNLKDLKDRGTSLARKCTWLGTYRRPRPRVQGGS